MFGNVRSFLTASSPSLEGNVFFHQHSSRPVTAKTSSLCHWWTEGFSQVFEAMHTYHLFHILYNHQALAYTDVLNSQWRQQRDAVRHVEKVTTPAGFRLNLRWFRWLWLLHHHGCAAAVWHVITSAWTKISGESRWKGSDSAAGVTTESCLKVLLFIIYDRSILR